MKVNQNAKPFKVVAGFTLSVQKGTIRSLLMFEGAAEEITAVRTLGQEPVLLGEW